MKCMIGLIILGEKGKITCMPMIIRVEKSFGNDVIIKLLTLFLWPNSCHDIEGIKDH